MNETDPARTSFKAGICTGTVRGIAFADPDICPPEVVTQGQMVRVVASYIDVRPSRQHESFEMLTMEVLTGC